MEVRVGTRFSKFIGGSCGNSDLKQGKIFLFTFEFGGKFPVIPHQGGIEFKQKIRDQK